MLVEFPGRKRSSTPANHPERVSLIVTTYNWPAALACCVRSVWRQTRLPDQIVIADDGSGPATRDLVEDLARQSPVPLHHLWHPDEGFRPGAIKNRAVLAADHPYLIFVDQDILLHPRMVEDHLVFARRGCLSQGKRAHLGRRSSRRILAAGEMLRPPLPWAIRQRHQYAIRLPFLSQRYPLSRDPMAGIMSANLGIWRDDVVRVNGFNEDFQGWGGQDTELVARLLNDGIRRQDLRFVAVAYHVYHRRQSTPPGSPNLRHLRRTIDDRVTRCSNGLSKYLDDADAGTPRKRGRVGRTNSAPAAG